jgi:hypothetical protein
LSTGEAIETGYYQDVVYAETSDQLGKLLAVKLRAALQERDFHRARAGFIQSTPPTSRRRGAARGHARLNVLFTVVASPGVSAWRHGFIRGNPKSGL